MGVENSGQTVDLRAKPYSLGEDDIRWVDDTIAAMTLEEKVGQLFVHLCVQRDDGELGAIIERYHVGGVRYINAPAKVVRSRNGYMQSLSKVPLLIAADITAGGNACCSEGTLVGTHLQCGATGDPEAAYKVGLVAGIEAAAVGCNWAFSPVVDIHYNWRNTNAAGRSFSDEPDKVLTFTKSWLRGLSASNVAAAIKHFPGDGVDERDPHLVTVHNSKSREEWEESFGRIYRALIDEGVPSIMAGHIALPAYSRYLVPGMTDEDLLPASLARELVTDLLKSRMRFNGLVVTDASSMGGMTTAKRRSAAIPGAIAAGCDMFLFFRDPEEDYGFMLDGCRDGTISQERLTDALRRILGLKASLNLHRLQAEGGLVPDEKALQKIGCAEHQRMAQEVAAQSITLVKDTESNLPITPSTYKRIKLVMLGEDVPFFGVKQTDVRSRIIDELEGAGFEVDPFENPLSAADGLEPIEVANYVMSWSIQDFLRGCDAVLVFANIIGFAQENTMRIRWASAMAPEIPWYATEVPTIFVSLNLPGHHMEVPSVKTYIDAYSSSPTVIRELIRKLTGKAEFTGSVPRRQPPAW